MATKRSGDELVSFIELPMPKEIYMEALVQLLLGKGVFTKKELLGKVKKDLDSV